PAVEDVREELQAAAFALAEAVLGHELSTAEGSGAHALTRLLATPVDLGVHTVRLHPADHAHVTAVLADRQVALPAGVELVADPTLGPGDVVSEYPDGWLDARVGEALERARRALAEATR